MSRSNTYLSDFNAFFQPTLHQGPRPSLANVDVTAQDLANAFHGYTHADYAAGKALWYIPVVPGDAAGLSAQHGSADDPIWAVVMGASELTPNAGMGYGATTNAAINQYQTGDPRRLTLLFRGTGIIIVFKYTGTAPAVTGTAAATHVVCDGSGGVKIAPNDTVAQQFGVPVIAVDTARQLVAVSF